MLTNLQERRRFLCSLYWSHEGDRLQRIYRVRTVPCAADGKRQDRRHRIRREECPVGGRIHGRSHQGSRIAFQQAVNQPGLVPQPEARAFLRAFASWRWFMFRSAITKTRRPNAAVRPQPKEEKKHRRDAEGAETRRVFFLCALYRVGGAENAEQGKEFNKSLRSHISAVKKCC